MMLVSPDDGLGGGRKLVEQDQELLIVRLEATPSEMRQLNLARNGLSDKWAVEFARRALPNMPRLEKLGLRGNDIGHAGAMAIKEELEKGCCPKLVEV